MIILRADETQALPRATATPQQQYAGEGAAWATAGGQIAHTANQAYSVVARLDDQQARETTRLQAKQYQSKLHEKATEYWDQWDQATVKQGWEPKTAVDQFGKWFEGQTADDRPGSENNPYMAGALETVYLDVRDEVLTKARAHANTSWVAQGKTRIGTILEDDMKIALRADAMGDVETYDNQVARALGYLKGSVGTILTEAEANEMGQSFVSSLREKQAYQHINRSPTEFLNDFHAGKFQDLDPKLGSSLVEHAYASIQRQSAMWDHTQRQEAAAAEERAVMAKSRVLQWAGTKPQSAWEFMLDPMAPTVLGKHFDDTFTTVKAMVQDGGTDNPETIKRLKEAIDLNPNTNGLYRDIEKALQNGQLKTGTFQSFTTRLIEQREKLKNEVKAERHRIITDEVQTRTPMFDVDGIMGPFDTISNWAKGEYRNEFNKRMEADTENKLDPRRVSQDLFMKYKEYSEGQMSSIATQIRDKKGLTGADAGDVLDALQEGKLTENESDMLLWLLRYEGKQAPAASTQTAKPQRRRKAAE